MGNKAGKAESSNARQDDDEIDGDNPTNQKQSTSYYTMIKQSYQQLVNAIIRPPRCNYETSQLGPKTFAFCGKTFERTDFELVNPRGLKFVCSMWEPVAADRPNNVLPCVIYMHGNSSSRLEALSSLSLVLSIGATLMAFDFCGSGKSEGEYVSLGAFEKDDLARAIEYLRDAGRTSTIALWGRSMGAATALLHGERDPSIAGMVLDSAFADLVMLAEMMVESGREKGLFAPGMLVKIAIRFVRSSVQKAAGFDIRALSPIEHADKCYIPAMFIAAENDNFVSKVHSEKICEKYGGDKNLVIVEGDHNSARPMFLYDSIGIFLLMTLQIPEAWVLPEGNQFIRKYPWTYKSRHLADMQAERDTFLARLIRNNGGYPVEGGNGGGGTDGLVDELGGELADEDDMALQEILALSLLESEQNSYHENHGGGGTVATRNGKASATDGSQQDSDHAKIMEKDAQMQDEVQSKLFNLLNGGVGVPPMSSERKAPPPVKASGGSSSTTHNSKVTAKNQHEKAFSASGGGINHSGGGASKMASTFSPAKPGALNTSHSASGAATSIHEQLNNSLDNDEEGEDCSPNKHSAAFAAASSPTKSPGRAAAALIASDSSIDLNDATKLPFPTHVNSSSAAEEDASATALHTHPKALADRDFGKDSSFNRIFSGLPPPLPVSEGASSYAAATTTDPRSPLPGGVLRQKTLNDLDVANVMKCDMNGSFTLGSASTSALPALDSSASGNTIATGGPLDQLES